MRRTKLEIYKEILELSKNSATKTQIVYGCNLNFKIYKGYVKFLLDKGMLVLEEIGKRTYYLTTKKGINEIEKLSKINLF